ncbi:MAG: substrate-binding domain-containing protein [Bacteroidia bacterium]|nr:substrate-binding domain-containing protein [Bacteroidia bacterium]
MTIGLHKLALLWLIFLLISCESGNNGTSETDTPTTGKIRIAVDESFKPVLDTQISTFEALYKYAKIEPIYTNESDAISKLMEDSVRLIVIPRTLTPEEQQPLDKIQLRPRNTKIAYDAVCFIVHPSQKDSTIDVDDVKDILTGKKTNWAEINPKHLKAPIQVVFDHRNSSIVRYLIDSLLHGEKITPKASAVSSTQEVINYIAAHPNSLGCIGLAWISDGEDSTSNQFLSKIKVLSVGRKPDFYEPFQYYLLNAQYPFRRSVYIVSREARTGLGTGFASFVAGEKGQRIILKADLLPATMPIRLVELKTKEIQ